MALFRRKHPFPLTTVTLEGRRNRRALIKELIYTWPLVHQEAIEKGGLSFSVKIGEKYHLMRLENLESPQRSDYDYRADLLRFHDFFPLTTNNWYRVGRVKFNAFAGKLSKVSITHLKAVKVKPKEL